MKILEDAGVLVPKGGVAKSPEQAYEIATVLCKYSSLFGAFVLHRNY